mmetsp:Transcript_24258/g.54218  ORF Transcript_24258/g.54218 Transcript_24258/m.54218 type:complete len:519 (+) Transcript_24258:699-2255(+)
MVAAAGGVGARLTEGGVHQLVASEGDHCDVDCPTPTLQLISLRRVPANALTDVYWAVLSDGDSSIEVVISSHLSHLVQSGNLGEFCIIKVKAWQYNITDDNIHILQLAEVDVLENAAEKLGDPAESILNSMHKRETGGSEHYFDDEDWDAASEEESEPLTWSLGEPSAFCDWSIEVTTQIANSKGKRKVKREGSNIKTSQPSVQVYHVHKAILSSGRRRSEYFTTLFKQSHLYNEFESNTSKIQLEESAAVAFPDILDYLYKDKNVRLTASNATAVRHLAHYFGIRSLWKCASSYIKGDFSIETAPVYLSEAMLYHDTKLEQASLDILAEKIEEVSRRILINLPPQSFERIVTSPKLRCRSKKLSDVVLKYCQTQRSNVNLDLLMRCTRQDVMPSVSRKSALPLLKVAVAEEEKTGVNLKNTNNVLRSRCVDACVEEWKETLAKPLLALESRDKNISRILAANSVEHRDLPLTIQVELLEKALCAAKIELDDVKAELLYREEQVEKLTSKLSGSQHHG